MSKSCTCCGFPDAQNYGHYSACSMCLPRNSVERITEATVKDSETTAKKLRFVKLHINVNQAYVTTIKHFIHPHLFLSGLNRSFS